MLEKGKKMQNNNQTEMVITSTNQASVDAVPLSLEKVYSEAGLEIVETRYVAESGQIVNPGVAKSVWDEVLLRSGMDPAAVVEYNCESSS